MPKSRIPKPPKIKKYRQAKFSTNLNFNKPTYQKTKISSNQNLAKPKSWQNSVFVRILEFVILCPFLESIDTLQNSQKIPHKKKLIGYKNSKCCNSFHSKSKFNSIKISLILYEAVWKLLRYLWNTLKRYNVLILELVTIDMNAWIGGNFNVFICSDCFEIKMY